MKLSHYVKIHYCKVAVKRHSMQILESVSLFEIHMSQFIVGMVDTGDGFC